MTLGSREPRICVVPDGDEHPRWGEALELLDKLDTHLDPWQLDILHASMLRRGDVWAAFTVAIVCGRQNGKNEILQARELIGALLLNEPLLIHTAHLADTCMEAFTRLDDLIDSNDWLLRQVDHVARTNGREAIYFSNGSRIRFRTRTRGGGRGFAASPVFFDESMFFPVISQNAILPVMSAQPDPQAWYTGTAVDKLEHDDGVTFARVRERALAGVDDRLAYFEWSLDVPSPDELSQDLASDLEAWATANPALGIRITPEYITAEKKELTARGFAVERLGVGDWPATDGLAVTVIPIGVWDDLADPVDSTLEHVLAVAYDVSPERRASIAAVGIRADGLYGIEILENHTGTSWLPERVVELADEYGLSSVRGDGGGTPAASMAEQIEAAGVKVEQVNAGELAQACGRLLDAVSEGSVRHSGSVELREALRGARTRPLGDSWAWSRKNSTVDISPLVAATLALWEAVESPAGDPVIY